MTFRSFQLQRSFVMQAFHLSWKKNCTQCLMRWLPLGRIYGLLTQGLIHPVLNMYCLSTRTML
ncbi:hypothetical protein KSP40_PGU012930 [Platanthera guangdongensis]|uniref:Uncharacterized protein n=1 Tax=Platanthera guangdongensis TaxID=2320717 RepID=A0ABR2LH61_9ASPA